MEGTGEQELISEGSSVSRRSRQLVLFYRSELADRRDLRGLRRPESNHSDVDGDENALCPDY